MMFEITAFTIVALMKGWNVVNIMIVIAVIVVVLAIIFRLIDKLLEGK